MKRGKLVGFDIDLINIIAKRLGYKLEIQDMELKDIFSALKKNEIDVAISSITATKEREQEIRFSSVYYTTRLALLHRKADHIYSLDDLHNKTVAAIDNSVMKQFLIKYLIPNRQTKLVTFTYTHYLVEALEKGKIDAALVEKVTAKRELRKDKKFGYFFIKTPFQNGYAVAFPKDSHLQTSFNNVILDLKISGQLEALKKKWKV